MSVSKTKRCYDLFKDFSDEKHTDFMRKNNLSLTDFKEFLACFEELILKDQTKTIYNEVAKIFVKYGFFICAEDNGLTFVIKV